MAGKLASSIVQLLIVLYMQQVGGAGHWIFRPIGLVLWRKFWAGHQNLESSWLGKNQAPLSHLGQKLWNTTVQGALGKSLEEVKEED